MILNVLVQLVKIASNVSAAKMAVTSLAHNSKSFRYRQGEVVSYWRKAAEQSFADDYSTLVKFKTLRWVPADGAVEAKLSHEVVTGKVGAYAAIRTSWDYSLV